MKILLTGLFLCLGLTGLPANAALESRLGGLAVYDSGLNITWLADANLAASNTFGVSGINQNGYMTWDTAKSWIGAMNAANYLGYHDWRLPTAGPVNGTSMNHNWSYDGSTDVAYNISAPGSAYAGNKSSEMAYLFYNGLGNNGHCNPAASTPSSCGALQAGWGLTNTGPFSNFQSTPYWSGTEEKVLINGAWDFSFSEGYQDYYWKNSFGYALAVRPGQIAAVPVPAAVWLLGSGLIGFAGVARKRNKAKRG